MQTSSLWWAFSSLISIVTSNSCIQRNFLDTTPVQPSQSIVVKVCPGPISRKMMQTKGGLISFNNFLSTSKDRNVSLAFALSNKDNPDLVGILFVITIDLSQSTTPFASISDVSHYHEEDGVLFSIHTVFRIREIKPMDENNRLFQVSLTLTNDKDKDLCALAERIRRESKGFTGWYRLGELPLDMGQSEKAQQIYEVMLKQTRGERKKGDLYDRIGVTKYNQGEYQEAITFFEKSLEIKRETLPPNHHNLVVSYNNIGNAYDNMGKYSKALSYYQKALAIQQESLRPNHPDLSTSYDNIGSVYYNMREFSEALSYYEKSLAIKQQSLPSTHPDFGASYNNIGLVYDSMGEYSKALSFYLKALAIQQQSLPPNHRDFGASYNNIGVVYKKMDDYSKAQSFYERAVDNGKRSLPRNHPHMRMYREKLELIKKEM